MVDRITPATTDRERGFLKERFGVEDTLAGVLRGIQAMGGRGPFPVRTSGLEKVGVTFTHDVAPYELMKIRILNGGHAAIAYPAGLLDIHFVHEAMEDSRSARSWRN